METKDVLKDEPQAEKSGKKEKEPKITGAERKQRRLFKKRRGGVVLTEDEVQAIKAGRKKLRKEMKAMGIRSKKEFELTASGLGLYFDKRKFCLLWFLHGRGLWALLGAALALLAAGFAFSLVTELRGHFTINLGDDLLKEGFSLSDTIGFENPTMRLFADPVTDAPCFSIADIHEDVNEQDGQHSEAEYFAYTFYIRNEGETTVDFAWQLALNSESQNLSEAVWVMLFEDDVMELYAEARADGTAEALPSFGDNSRGYLSTPLMGSAASPDTLYQVIAQKGSVTYYRVVPEVFEGEETVTSGYQSQVEPWEVHKYTIVIWLEGDDPDCTNEKIGGHIGMEMNFQLVDD